MKLGLVVTPLGLERGDVDRIAAARDRGGQASEVDVELRGASDRVRAAAPARGAQRLGGHHGHHTLSARGAYVKHKNRFRHARPK
ncbi:MAG TPA: hypothetical protein VNO30_42240 [Kofleriaceae bacterium]|nr:hypothetical protein [Kofleriaceae bacterium]